MAKYDSIDDSKSSDLNISLDFVVPDISNRGVNI